MLSDKIIKLIRIIAAAVLIPVIFLLSGCGAIGPGYAIIFAGSTSVQPYVELLAEKYEHEYPDTHIDIQGGGSSAGIKAVFSGTADIGMSSRHLKESERELYVIDIAIDGLAVIINPKNTVVNLTIEQIRSIYTRAVTNWDELGGAHSKIHVIAREEGSGTRSAFEELVMGDAFITPRAIIQDSNGAVKQLVSSDPGAIGFISLGLIDETVKPVQIGGVAPTQENVRNSDYTLYRTFILVSITEPEGEIKAFIDYILSSAGQKILADEGLIPVR